MQRIFPQCSPMQIEATDFSNIVVLFVTNEKRKSYDIQILSSFNVLFLYSDQQDLLIGCYSEILVLLWGYDYQWCSNVNMTNNEQM